MTGRFIHQAWYVAALSSEVTRATPLARQFWDDQRA